MSGFQLHSDLFQQRTRVQHELAKHGFEWLTNYRSIDLDHNLYGIEVCGIDVEDDAIEIEQILCELFPEWTHHRHFYWDYSLDDGWKVEISKSMDDQSESWAAS